MRAYVRAWVGVSEWVSACARASVCVCVYDIERGTDCVRACVRACFVCVCVYVWGGGYDIEGEIVCVCVRACVRACVGAWVRGCV